MSYGQTRTTYADGTFLTSTQPWGLFMGGAALCPDGKVRRLKRIAGTADTFFSVPAAVEVRGRTVTGYVTVQTREGLSTPTEDDPPIVKFFPVKNRKNSDAFEQG
jgi:hypothetical protein